MYLLLLPSLARPRAVGSSPPKRSGVGSADLRRGLASPEFQLRAHLDEDRPLYPDHHHLKALVQPGEILDEVEKAIGSLE